MFTITGKHNFANVMIDYIDEETTRQIYSFLNHPAFADTYIAIMPDTHAGAGAVIGYTAKMNNYVIPNVVGVDIGCGVLAIRLGDLPTYDLSAVDNMIKKLIPSGFAHRAEPYKINDENLTERIEHTASMIGLNPNDVLRQLGTLGGGNHFIEIDKAPDKALWLVVHTGSRNFGLQVAQHYQNKAKELMKTMFIGDAYKNLEFLPRYSQDGINYMTDMKVAQDFAAENRRIIASIITQDIFGQNPTKGERIESVHNFIGEDNVIRKGAIQANEEQKVIIPFNMRDGVAIGTGKGSKMWNKSAPHGAGRIMSRSQAKKDLVLADFTEQMKGIYTTTACQNTIDEAPMAYKDKDLIVSAIAPTVNIDFFMKPCYNFKAGGD